MDWGSILGAFTGFILTLLIFSYLLGDNGLFRFTVHLFVGVAAAYMAAVAFYSVVWPRLIQPIIVGLPVERLLALVPLGLSLLLLAKASRRFSSWGTPVMAFLVGVGAATAIGGAIFGTLFPQVQASMNLLDIQAILSSGKALEWELFNGAIILLGTVVTLAYFQFLCPLTQTGLGSRSHDRRQDHYRHRPGGGICRRIFGCFDCAGRTFELPGDLLILVN